MHNVSSSMKKLGIDQLGAEERLDLLEEIWESLDADALPLTEAHRAELEARLREHCAEPNDVVDWNDVKRAVFPPRDKR